MIVGSSEFAVNFFANVYAALNYYGGSTMSDVEAYRGQRNPRRRDVRHADVLSHYEIPEGERGGGIGRKKTEKEYKL